MGRILSPIRISNLKDLTNTLSFEALVDTGAAYMVLPNAWRNKLGKLDKIRNVTIELADQTHRTGEVCGPVKIELDGFQPIYGEVLFVDMVPRESGYEPLLGYIPLEQAQATIDMTGHKLVPVKTVDLKLAA